MSHTIFDCKHVLRIDDMREGTEVCMDCGLVLNDKIFVNHESVFYEEIVNTNVKSEIIEMLERLNLPKIFAENIEKTANSMISEDKVKKNLTTVVASSMYKTINRNKVSISIKDVSAVSGVSEKKILGMDKSIHILESENVLEKYCTLNNLDYKNYTVIKENLKKYKVLGHNPLTLVGAVIYMHCKKNKIKTSMKSISQTLGISTISIQRFIKNELSFRC
jgi:transcription initiation factor TFIIIB Brf1 subunit/transcription initiation factor TFIIB